MIRYVAEICSNFLKNIFGNMPLKESLGDYDSYWKEREKIGICGTKERAERIIKFLGNEKGSVLDFGCGDGTTLSLFKEKGFDAEGIDISKKAVNLCRKRGLKADVFDISKSNIKKSYDYITLLCVLEHIQDSETVIKKLKGKFRKNLIVCVPNAAFFENRIRLLFGRFPIVPLVFHVKEHIRFWSVSDFKYWADVNGFKVAKVASASPRFLPSLYPSLFATNIIYFLTEK